MAGIKYFFLILAAAQISPSRALSVPFYSNPEYFARWEDGSNGNIPFRSFHIKVDGGLLYPCRVKMNGTEEIVPGHLDIGRSGCVIVSKERVMVADKYQTLVSDFGISKFVYRSMNDNNAEDFDPFPVGVDKNGETLYSGYVANHHPTLGSVDYKFTELKYEKEIGDVNGTISKSFTVLGLTYLQSAGEVRPWPYTNFYGLG